ncbi:TetR/AcrR family transcriptional regulator [Vibrio sp. SCSIO 43136]|uniref:TetR/AcrR family transcriptional regulator n=1 Tax=Vibrio sp. SCSIO 43136 TaxID=2819101 RepID=UPI002074B849|nr:TetR/AcrR family transcriptional regulator [Vibrio sp. SCSIO 43136]USD67552.1 TetR/AcrR family transcriptional regulator [Vibrio sp. SCSIO 43136]
MLKQQIAERLEQAFSQHGFAQPSVSQLKTECDVSLRTLYKHFPSKEAMIVGALEFRHQRYLKLLADNPHPAGLDAVEFAFEQLKTWMVEYAPNGCMSVNAMAAFPDNELINQAVKKHKLEVKDKLGNLAGNEPLAASLYLLHEGVSSAWAVLGDQAIISAKMTLKQLIKDS